MKIIIIGDGKVGHSLAEILSQEGNDVTIIDKDGEALRKASENLDVLCIKGNGVSTAVLLEAGVKEADLLITATASDEINMVCCLTAKKLGVQNIVARIRDPEYAKELSALKNDLGLDMVINPEQATAGEISRLIKFPAALNVETFAKGRVEMVEIRATAEMSVVGKKLQDFSGKYLDSVLIGAVQRDDEIIIPHGDFKIKADDILYIIGQPSKVYIFCRNIGVYMQKIKNVMIMGGGRIAYYLAQYLDEVDIKVKLIELNRERCVELTELLPRALVICGDGTDEELLHNENLEDMGAFVSVTGRDEDNLISALLAKRRGVKKVVAKINRLNYLEVIKDIGLDNVVSPKLVTANFILSFVRGLKNAVGNPVNALYRIIQGRAEVLEFTADKSTAFLNIPLKNLKLIKGILIAALSRGNDIIIPHGNDRIEAGDSVILITKDKKISDLNDIAEGVN